MKPLFSLLFLSFIILNSFAQSTQERINNSNVYFYPVKKARVLVELSTVEGKSIDYDKLEERDDLVPETRFNASDSEGYTAGEIAYVEDLDRKYIDLINLYARELVEEMISKTLTPADPKAANEDEGYFYVETSIISKTMSETVYCGIMIGDNLAVSFSIGIGIYEHIPGKSSDKRIFSDFNDVTSIQHFPSDAVTNPRIAAYRESKPKFYEKITTSLVDIRDQFEKKLPKKLSK